MRAAENPLEKHFRANDGRLIHKWLHYFDIYDRHFAAYRKEPVTVLEFGVAHGGSLQMWKEYFGRKARIIGVDIEPMCAKLAEKQIDIVIEDGGHTMTQQINTFEEIWPGVKDGGVFLIEDLHTSYWEKYGGGNKKPGTFIEYAKDLVDQVNAYHSHDPSTLNVDDYTRSIRGMHIYDSIIEFDKGTVIRPTHERTGTLSW